MTVTITIDAEKLPPVLQGWARKGQEQDLDALTAFAASLGLTDLTTSEWVLWEWRKPAPPPVQEPWWWALKPGDQLQAKELGGCAIWHGDNAPWLRADGTPRLATWRLGVIALDKERERIQVALPATGWPSGLWVRPGDVERA